MICNFDEPKRFGIPLGNYHLASLGRAIYGESRSGDDKRTLRCNIVGDDMPIEDESDALRYGNRIIDFNIPKKRDDAFIARFGKSFGNAFKVFRLAIGIKHRCNAGFG